jgi:hypothetical protein
VPSTVVLAAGAIVGIRTGGDHAGRVTLAIMRAADARCPTKVARPVHPIVRDGAVAADRWARCVFDDAVRDHVRPAILHMDASGQPYGEKAKAPRTSRGRPSKNEPIISAWSSPGGTPGHPERA